MTSDEIKHTIELFINKLVLNFPVSIQIAPDEEEDTTEAYSDAEEARGYREPVKGI